MYIYIYNSSHMYPDLEPVDMAKNMINQQIAACLDS